jgi:cytochrome c oxidase subunit 2
MNLRIAICLAALATGLGGCGANAGEGENRGPVVFADNCGQCHGVNGAGNPDIEAPAIAGLPSWYVESQLMKFRMGIRGAHAEDLPGLRMRPMSRTLEERDITAVAEYVSVLGAVTPDEIVKGDPEAGKAAFGTCVACHQENGLGNEALAAPPIAQLDDWYIRTQLHNFKKGIRGADPRDTTGAQMAPMARTLADDKAVNDVVAYISTLR